MENIINFILMNSEIDINFCINFGISFGSSTSYIKSSDSVDISRSNYTNINTDTDTNTNTNTDSEEIISTYIENPKNNSTKDKSKINKDVFKRSANNLPVLHLVHIPYELDPDSDSDSDSDSDHNHNNHNKYDNKDYSSHIKKYITDNMIGLWHQMEIGDILENLSESSDSTYYSAGLYDIVKSDDTSDIAKIIYNGLTIEKSNRYKNNLTPDIPVNNTFARNYYKSNYL